MSTLNIKKINSRLQAKGFEKEEKDHHFFYYTYNGERTKIYTKTSFGSKKEIGDSLISKMATQVHLKKEEFMRLIECTLSKEDYRDLLLEKGLIKR